MLSFIGSLSPDSEAFAVFVNEKHDYKGKGEVLPNATVQKINSFLKTLKTKKKEEDINSFDVSDIGYFVYCNGISEKDEFNNQLEFRTKLIPYKGNDAWVEPTLMEVKETLLRDSPPDADSKCSYCAYVKKTLMI